MKCLRYIIGAWKGFSFSGIKSPQQLEYFNNRMKQLPQHPYPHFYPTISITDFHKHYQKLKSKASEGNESEIEKVCGRIWSIRTSGKATFIDILQQSNRLQIVLPSDNETLKKVQRGDIIGVSGNAFATEKGELSFDVTEIEIISPCLWKLPVDQSFNDLETRYRQKYLDLIMNRSSLEVLKKRSHVISSLRTFLEAEGYIEIQTPILSKSCGGAVADPFSTYHNDHKMPLYLRIAPELDLKKLVVGGIQRVFQIGKIFRNESIDNTHSPEYTGCELYCAYSDYEKMIQLTYRMVNYIAKRVNGTSKFLNPEGQEIDLGEKWKEVDFMEGLQQALGIELPIDFELEETVKFYDEICKKNNVACDEPRTIERLLDKLGGKYLETSIQPLVIKNHPKIISPLSKSIQGKPHLTQRFELFINGCEIVNSYTDQNIPHIQLKSTPDEKDYVEALEYGLVPCAGWGMGIDRLIMLLTQKERIQEVIAFPLLSQGNQEVS